MLAKILAITFSFFCAAPALAQEFEPLRDKAQFRDAILTPDGRALYLAAYDRNEVWVIDASGVRTLTIPVGKGPSSLALDEATGDLAVTNRLDDTVSFIAPGESTVRSTVKVPKGPSDIAALGGGRFAVVSTMADAVSIVSATSQEVSPLASSPSVPVAVAAAGGRLYVASRFESAVQSFDSESLAPGRRTKLAAQPVSISALDNGNLAVSGPTAITVYEAASGAEVATVAGAAVDLAAAGDSLYALSGDTILQLDAQLQQVNSSAVPGGASKIGAGAGTLVALSPQASRALVRAGRSAEIQVAAAPHTESAVVEARPVEPEVESPVEVVLPVEPRALELPVPVIQEEAPVPAETVADMARPEQGRESQPEAVPGAGQVNEPETMVAMKANDAAEADIDAPAAETGGGRTIRQHPVRTEEIGAPKIGDRPSSVPLRELSNRTIADALMQPTEFGSTEAGFQPPDWREPFRDIVAPGQLKFNENMIHAEGKITLRWGDMDFAADEFSYAQDLGDIHAMGNVSLTQGSSRLLADELHYDVPDAAAVPAPGPLSAPLDPEGQERRRLSLGTLDAVNVDLIEPTRSLKADKLHYDFSESTGEIWNARGQAGVYFYSANHLRILGPASLEGDDVWVTTCDQDPPHYKIRLSRAVVEDGSAVGGTNARLQLGKFDTPFYLPKWRQGGTGAYPWTFDFDSGRRAELGYFMNVGQRYEITPDFAIGPRLMPTEKQGVGFGGDFDYNYMESPASWLYRSQGEFHGLYTTKDRGYLEWYHRYEPNDDLVVRVQAEQWSDEDFYKDFFWDEYRNRSTPRTFANVTYRQDTYIATATVAPNTHNWVGETERMPEATFHALEQPLAENLYFSFDTINGYNDREPDGPNGMRSINLARLTYDIDLGPSFSLTPYVELEGSWYSKTLDSDSGDARFSSLAGVTGQTRFHKEYAGRWGFSAFKHVVVPSLTYSYQPESNLEVTEVPRFDSLDNVFGRSRIETKLSNILYGRDADTSEVWQVGRLTLYTGTDLWNETNKSQDYEIEVDVRPRPWGGFQLVAERHDIDSNFGDEGGFWNRRDYQDAYNEIFDLYDRQFGYNDTFYDYDRVLAQLYYDERPWSGRVGYAYTKTQDQVFNREILYGLGYEFSDKWGVGFEHRYDMEDGNLRSQSYEVRRSLHCWETAIRVRDRESGFDIDLEFNIKAFPGSRLKL